jgi:hypothetical protein
MENVPKIVKDRLKSAAPAVDHPDAELLTAFSERALAERERGQILEHLAHCVECREVVALAFPAEEPGLSVARPIRGGWFTWPRLRWGLVAAGVIVVGSFGALRYEGVKDLEPVAFRNARTDRPTNEAEDHAKSLPVVSEEARERKSLSVPAEQSQALALQSQIAEAQEKTELVAKSQAPGDEKAVSGNHMTVLRDQTLPHGPKPPTQSQQNLNANTSNQRMMFQSQAPAPARAANEQAAAGMMVSAQSVPASALPAAGPVPSAKQTQDLDSLAINGQSVTVLPATRGNNGAEVARAKDAEPLANAPKAQAAGAYDVSETSTSNFSPSGSLVPESARWAINSAGGLQRSFDQGKNWQPVDVSRDALEPSAVNVLAMKSSHAKEAAKKADSKPKPIVFRAVAANGPDVWAGGSEAALFHSMDSGDHWIRIQPSWRGVQLNGDILSLQFADPQHGRIVTSTAEIWTTADAGQTWDKQ